MIYLKFPEEPAGRIVGAVITKPSFLSAIITALNKVYKVDVVVRYAKPISDFIYENVDFPAQGIYRVQGENFWRFDEETNT